MSVASAWEMAIKVSLGRLSLPKDFEGFINYHLTANRISLLEVTLRHTERVSLLPFHHRDPFDRLIVAQSLVEGWPVVSQDVAFDAYGVERIC